MNKLRESRTILVWFNAKQSSVIVIAPPWSQLLHWWKTRNCSEFGRKGAAAHSSSLQGAVCVHPPPPACCLQSHTVYGLQSALLLRPQGHAQQSKVCVCGSGWASRSQLGVLVLALLSAAALLVKLEGSVLHAVALLFAQLGVVGLQCRSLAVFVRWHAGTFLFI